MMLVVKRCNGIFDVGIQREGALQTVEKVVTQEKSFVMYGPS